MIEHLTDKVLARTEGGVGWLIINNPERRNAISLEMWQAISQLVEQFGRDDQVRVVIMAGSGGKAFASGADISQFEKNRSNAAEADAYRLVGDKARNALRALDKPVVAMIEGFCLGGGLAVAMTADLRVASSTAEFGVPAGRLGLTYGSEDITRLVQLVGPSKASELLFTARRISAAEGQKIGLVDQLTDPQSLETTTRAMAETMTANAPLSLRAAKITIREALRPNGAADRQRVEEAGRICFDSEDYREGVRAFLEKRAPVFIGR